MNHQSLLFNTAFLNVPPQAICSTSASSTSENMPSVLSFPCEDRGSISIDMAICKGTADQLVPQLHHVSGLHLSNISVYSFNPKILVECATSADFFSLDVSGDDSLVSLLSTFFH